MLLITEVSAARWATMNASARRVPSECDFVLVGGEIGHITADEKCLVAGLPCYGGRANRLVRAAIARNMQESPPWLGTRTDRQHPLSSRDLELQVVPVRHPAEELPHFWRGLPAARRCARDELVDWPLAVDLHDQGSLESREL
jgi:hypothetical protein